MVDVLTDRERIAYEQHLLRKEPPLAPSTQAQMFELYLNGLPLDEIARLNKPHRLGSIVRAAVEGDWSGKRLEYVDSLLNSIVPRVTQTQSESISFVTDLLAAAHKQHGDRLKRFIQTGDEALLGDFSLRSLQSYKTAVEMLLKLTGQDKPGKTGEGPPQVKTVAQTQVASRPLLEEEAEDVLAALQGAKKVVK